MKKLVALLVVLMFGTLSCYNTYHITMDQLKELQSSDKGALVVNSEEGQKVEVNQGTRLFVRDVEGKKWQVTPFNFKVTGAQLVASDRDYIFMLSQLKPKGEVELLSTAKTVGAIAVAAGLVAGLIAYTVSTAGQKSFSSPGE